MWVRTKHDRVPKELAAKGHVRRQIIGVARERRLRSLQHHSCSRRVFGFGKSMQEYIISYSFLVPTFDAYRGIISDLEKRGHQVTVRKIGKFEQQIGVLTENQERIFWLALKSGFFYYPRQIGMAELATKLGISTATLSEIMRRGTRRLLEHYFKREL